MSPFEFHKLLLPLAHYCGGRYEMAANMLLNRRVSGDYSIVAALLYAVCNHHMGNYDVAMAYYRDIYDKANRLVFFNLDSTEYIKAFIERYALEATQSRSFQIGKVNYFLRRFFPIGTAS